MRNSSYQYAIVWVLKDYLEVKLQVLDPKVNWTSAKELAEELKSSGAAMATVVTLNTTDFQ